MPLPPPPTSTRRELQRELLETVARALHDFLRPVVMLPDQPGEAAWLYRLRNDDIFRTKVRGLVAEITHTAQRYVDARAPGVSVHTGNDGVWMTLTTRDGNCATFQPGSSSFGMAQKPGVVGKAVQAWCAEREDDAAEARKVLQ